MLEFSKQVLKDSGIRNIIVSGDNYDVPDQIKQSGPVAGILSVLAKYPQVKSLLILPVDLPFMTVKALTELRLKGELSQKATFFKDHNIPLYLPNNAYIELFLKDAFTTVEQNGNKINDAQCSGSRFKVKGPSIKFLLKQIPHQALICEDSHILFNTNTPDEWQQAQQQF